MPLLAGRFSDNGFWTNEVFWEVRNLADTYRDLEELSEKSWPGVPVECFDHENIQRVRISLGGTAANATHHLGEATSIVVAKRESHVFVTDDQDATRVARYEGLRTSNTIAILRGLVADGVVSRSKAHELLMNMIDIGNRKLPRLEKRELGKEPSSPRRRKSK